MENERHRRVEIIFHASRSREAGPERQAYLDGACGDDADLRSRVDSLLAAHDEAAGFLEGPAVEGTREGPGSSIGPYKLLQEIGEGGMGVVYMAEQQEPVRRKVAIKVIKLGMDTKQVIARFEAERQALAMMDHANIARVLDAGSTETGRPYFVMELVRGVPIDEYCDTHKLATDERLALFIDVCRAVQHAHQKGIIHRDLKPTNVLITSHDGTPVPKIIDFGVAKATNQNLTERTLFTEYRQIIGTPEYMSPEQAEMSGLDVDTRSDIYSLGVLLYQLLTGTTPVNAQDLRTAGFEEMTRMIREDEAPVPSTRISKLGADGEKIAKHRASDAGSLSRNFRGDLDWIVMKALEKDRTRRYDTASAFAQDVTRHLEDLPVEAGAPGTVYRVRKFVHRHRAAATAALIIVAVVGLGMAGTTAGFLRARSEARRSGRISDTLQDVLSMTDPARASDLDGQIEEMLVTVREDFGEDHATFAAVLNTLAAQLYDAGEFEAAEPLYRESLEVWKRAYGENHFNVGITLGRLGKLLRAQGKDEEAAEVFEEALAIFAGASDAAGLAGYEARAEFADLLSNRGEYQKSAKLLQESLAALRGNPSPRHYRILQTLENLLVVQLNESSNEAGDTLRQVYEKVREFYDDASPLLAVSALTYGGWLFQREEYDEAEPYLREALRRFHAYDNPPDFYVLAAGDKLFQILRRRTDPESLVESDNLMGELIESARPIWGADTIASNLAYYAGRMLDQGRHADALDAMLEGHATLVEAKRTTEEREDLRDNLALLVSRIVVHPDLAPEVWAKARKAAETAIAEEPNNPSMIAALGAVLYRQGEHARSIETLERISKPLCESRSALARRIAPADQAFRALAHASVGDPMVAREELEALRAELAGSTDNYERALLKQVEALVDPTPSSSEDG